MAEPGDIVAAHTDGAPLLCMERGYVHLRDSTHNRKRGMYVTDSDALNCDLFEGELADEELVLLSRIKLAGTDFLQHVTLADVRDL